MTEKNEVHLEVTSRYEDQVIRQSFAAQRYLKGANEYFRYRETEPEMGKTMTTVKVGPDGIRVIRHGDIESEQTFVVDGRRPGYYKTAQGILELGTETRSVTVDLIGGIGLVSWSYDLLVSGEYSGTFNLELRISEAEPAGDADSALR